MRSAGHFCLGSFGVLLLSAALRARDGWHTCGAGGCSSVVTTAKQLRPAAAAGMPRLPADPCCSPPPPSLPPRGFAYVEFETRAAADKARDHMDGGQVDGSTVTVQFVLQPKRREPSPAPRGRDDRGRSPPRRAPSPRRGPSPRRRSPLPPRRRCGSEGRLVRMGVGFGGGKGCDDMSVSQPDRLTSCGQDKACLC